MSTIASKALSAFVVTSIAGVLTVDSTVAHARTLQYVYRPSQSSCLYWQGKYEFKGYSIAKPCDLSASRSGQWFFVYRTR